MDVEILIPIALFATIAYVTRVISDNRLIRKLADAPHVSSEAAERLAASRERRPGSLSALKWGLVVLALGLSILFVSVAGIDFDSPVAYGFVLFAAGTGLIAYYFIAREEDAGAAEPASYPSRRPYAETPRSSTASDPASSPEARSQSDSEAQSESGSASGSASGSKDAPEAESGKPSASSEPVSEDEFDPTAAFEEADRRSRDDE